MTVGAAKFGLLAAASGGATASRAWCGLISLYESGGTTYRVHTFRGSGEFEVSDDSMDLEVTYLIVAGGGGGGGGGGAGCNGSTTAAGGKGGDGSVRVFSW